jgi:hypothetical protein
VLPTLLKFGQKLLKSPQKIGKFDNELLPDSKADIQNFI